MSVRFRHFLLLTAWLAALAGTPAHAQSLSIGIAAPLSGTSALLGRQIETGAQAASEAISDRELSLTVADDACTAAGGTAAARRFIEAQVSVVVGFLCVEALEAALPILKAANIPTITPGVRVDSITDRRERTGWLVYRLAPRDDAERTAIAQTLIPLWRSELFAIIDDGTIYGRELAESFRAAAEETGLEPVFVDTFRPQLENQIALLGRLRRSGATHVFAGGDREDIAIMGRDAAGLDYALTIAGGEALRALQVQTPLTAGTLMVATPIWAEVASPEIAARLAQAGRQMDGYALPAHAAVEVAVAALSEAATTRESFAEVMARQSFETAIGSVRFDAKGDLTENPFRLYRYSGAQFVEVLE